MVKPVKQRNKGLLTFRANPPINLGVKKTSGSRVSLIPREARRLSNGSFEGYEPVSPRVSCIGQIECEIKRKRGVTVRKPKQASSLVAHAFAEHVKVEAAPSLRQTRQSSKGRSTLSGSDWRVYNAEGKGKVSNGRKCYCESDAQVTPKAAPSLQQMRQFDKGRSALSDFDWRTYDAGEKGVKRKRN